jgi:hypothetical protein
MAAVLVAGFLQANADLADERTALQMILSDLETDSVELTAQLSRGHRTEQAVLWLLRNINRDVPVDSVLGGMSTLFYYTSYEQVRVGYLNLLNAGRLTVIRDGDLRQDVVDYYELTQPYMWQFHEKYMVSYKELNDITKPYIRMIPEPEGDIFNQNFHMEMVRPWAEMKADYRFLAGLENIGAVGSQFGIRLGPALEHNAELRSAIRAELGM